MRETRVQSLGQEDPLEKGKTTHANSLVFTELYREEKREEGDRGGQEDKRRNQKERDRSSQ